MLAKHPPIFHMDITVHKELEELQIEIGKLRINNEILIISGRELLARAPLLINMPVCSSIVQETIEDIIQQQANEIQRLRNKLEQEKCRCFIAINQLEKILHLRELRWKEEFEKC